ncbi:FecR family protein [Gaoshiqia sp. Z1-71]|uniref:FecR family protein n=1 Tax=Gaoshiqia hydrogeniformans TaxID=3290090 RepID=UPI003BF84236
MTINADIDLLIIDYVHGDLPKDQEDELKSWVESSAENEAYFAKTIALLELSGSLIHHKKFNTEKDWNKLMRKIDPRRRIRLLLHKSARIAALFIFAFLLGYLTVQLKSKEKQNLTAGYIVTEVPYGNKSVVTLLDGSRVWINAGSKIRYPIDFNEKTRMVALEGEAFFDVVTDEKKPFYVEAFGLKVKATGTQFNVRAYKDEEFIETTLIEGIISVNHAEKTHKKDLVLQPNQKLTVYKDPIKPDKHEEKSREPAFSSMPLKIKSVELSSDIKTDIYTSWKDKEWIIYKEKFSVLAKKLERRYDVRIHIDDLALYDFAYSGTLKDENLKEVFEVLSFTSPIEYKLDNKNVYVWYNHHFHEK